MAYPEDQYATIDTADPQTGQTRTERVSKLGAVPGPDGVQYDRLAVLLLLDVVRRQRNAVAAVKARVAELGAKAAG